MLKKYTYPDFINIQFLFLRKFGGFEKIIPAASNLNFKRELLGEARKWNVRTRNQINAKNVRKKFIYLKHSVAWRNRKYFNVEPTIIFCPS